MQITPVYLGIFGLCFARIKLGPILSLIDGFLTIVSTTAAREGVILSWRRSFPSYSILTLVRWFHLIFSLILGFVVRLIVQCESIGVLKGLYFDIFIHFFSRWLAKHFSQIFRLRRLVPCVLSMLFSYSVHATM